MYVYRVPHALTLVVSPQDWFYVCPAHLKDTGFCTPKIDQAAIDARKKRELEEEIERVKKEYEEKQKRKKEKEAKDDKKDESGDKADKDKKPDEDIKKNSDKTESVSTSGALLLAVISD
jgi:chromatin remodeling complex protein RSC6